MSLYLKSYIKYQDKMKITSKTAVGMVILIMIISSCSTSKSIFESKPRTIQLEDIGSVSESITANGFFSWNCYEFGEYNLNQKPVLLELGYYTFKSDINEEKSGFLLYDGSNQGVMALYSRDGINHKWNWFDDSEGRYVFIIESDGNGLYYNFTGKQEAKPEQIFTCKIRK